MTGSQEPSAWQWYAAGALVAAADNDWLHVGEVIRDMQRVCGVDSICLAMLAWIDTVLAGHQGFSQVVLHVECAICGPSCEHPPPKEALWVGQLMAARLADDQDNYRTLVLSIPDGKAMGRHVTALLSTCVLMLQSDDPAVVIVDRQQL